MIELRREALHPRAHPGGVADFAVVARARDRELVEIRAEARVESFEEPLEERERGRREDRRRAARLVVLVAHERIERAALEHVPRERMQPRVDDVPEPGAPRGVAVFDVDREVEAFGRRLDHAPPDVVLDRGEPEVRVARELVQQ